MVHLGMYQQKPPAILFLPFVFPFKPTAERVPTPKLTCLPPSSQIHFLESNHVETNPLRPSPPWWFRLLRVCTSLVRLLALGTAAYFAAQQRGRGGGGRGELQGSCCSMLKNAFSKIMTSFGSTLKVAVR